MNTTTNLNRRQLIGTALATAAIMACKSNVTPSIQAKTQFAQDFLSDWELSGEVTLEFARAMPEEYYDFKPTPEVRSFAEHMLHIAESNIVNIARFVKGEKPPENDSSTSKKKDEIIAYLESSFDYVSAAAQELTDPQANETVAFPEGTRPRRKIFWYTRDHMTHHRGQTVTYFRLKGLTPPRYRG